MYPFWSSVFHISRPVARSQVRSNSLFSAVVRRALSGLNTNHEKFWCTGIVRNSAPVSTSHSFNPPPGPLQANHFPSGLSAVPRRPSGPSCLNARTFLLVDTFQIVTFLPSSVSADASHRP